MDGDKPLPLTEFDRLTVSESTQMIKAVVPFLDASTKKTISIYIRFQELMQTIEYFKKPLHAESTTSFDRSNFTMKDFLYETMPYLPKSTGDTLSSLQGFMEMFSMINMYKDMDQSQDFESIINMVKNMNDPNISEAFSNMGMGAGSDFSKSDNNTKDNNSKTDNSSEDPNDNFSGNDNGNGNDTDNDNGNGNTYNSDEAAVPYSNMMSAEQKTLYDKYLSEIENINFDNYKSDDSIN